MPRGGPGCPTFRIASAATAWVDSWPPATWASTPTPSPHSGWSAAARPTGARFPRLAATHCRSSTGSPPWLARACGALPGRRLGFGGDEARGLIGDWARVGLSGRYRAAGWPVDLEAGLHRVRAPIDGVLFDDDWLAPESSLRALMAKMPHAPARIHTLHHAALGTRADHFAWMKQPQAVIDALLS
jgi:predicted alpha/beta hydrolase